MTKPKDEKNDNGEKKQHDSPLDGTTDKAMPQAITGSEY